MDYRQNSSKKYCTFHSLVIFVTEA